MKDKELLNPNSDPSAEGDKAHPLQAGRGPIKFRRGAYTSTDKPIRILDACIALMVVLAVGLTVWNAIHGGFIVEFDAAGADHQPEIQKVRHGELIEEPQGVTRPGYVLKCWSFDPDKDIPWDFDTTKVGSDLTLRAVWEPASFEVRFDLAGGTVNGESETAPKTVTYGESYGELPLPEKEGFTFDGWLYSGDIITADTTVAMTGEHLLTAQWK